LTILGIVTLRLLLELISQPSEGKTISGEKRGLLLKCKYSGTSFL